MTPIAPRSDDRRATPLGIASDAPRRAVESRDPSTGELWRRFEPTDADSMAAIVKRAREVQPAWQATSLRDRLARIDAFHAALYRRRFDVAQMVSRENGKAVPEALAAEVAVVLDMARAVARQAPRILSAEWFTPTSLAMWRKRVRIEHEPFGVVAVISPWNYPFMLPAGVVLPALVTGNSVVLKPSEFTPSSAVLMAELFDEAKLPEGLFTVAPGDGITGALLTASDVDKVFFTGSGTSGHRVALSCVERGVPFVLELGGSDPAIVLRDADIENAASGILWGRFSNGGQTCVAPKRVFVERQVYPAFLAAMRTRIAQLQLRLPGSETYDVGGLIRPEQSNTLTAQLRDAVNRGALVEPNSPLGDSAGAAFPPTLITDVPADARVMREETFGPVLPVVPVDDANEAITKANDTMFGLSASVWSRNRSRALRVAQQLHAGTVMINDNAAVAGMSDVPHGGVKGSGTGRSHGMAGLAECVRPRAIIDDRFVSWRQAWWFGYAPTSVPNLDGYIRFAHGPSLAERLRGLAGTLRLLFRPERPI